MLFREYLNDNANDFCTGCGACLSTCDSNALSLKIGKNGNYQAFFDNSKCIQCNKCENICPILYKGIDVEHFHHPQIVAVQMPEKISNLCSSGGVFLAIAQNVIGQSGVVFGAAWKNNHIVEHIKVENIEDLNKLTGSKYVQSYIGNIFVQVKKELKTGRVVLFSGTPCQVSGLYSFLGKDYNNLITIDVLCFYSPAPVYFKKYMSEKYDLDKIDRVEFRDKSNGWSSTKMSIYDTNQKKSVCSVEEDDYQMAFHNQLMISEHCRNCKFTTLYRWGDLSLCDFWDAQQYYQCNDLGISGVFINSKKGKNELNKILGDTTFYRKINSKFLSGNRFESVGYRIPEQNIKRFQYLIQKYKFSKSVDYALNNKYDIALIGCWDIRNYGSHLTYYALYKLISNMGYEVVLIGSPEGAEYKSKAYPEYFKVNPYTDWDCSRQYKNKSDMRNANNMANTFVVGSDQVWNDKLYYHFGEFTFLDFIYDSKVKIAYATSFGKNSWNGPRKDIEKIKYYLNRFDSISVREQSGIQVCKQVFGVHADWALDPILVMDKEELDLLISKSNFEVSSKYLFAYILDYSEDKVKAIRKIAKQKGLEVYIVTDPNLPSDSRWTIEPLTNIYVEDWLKLFKYSDYIFTDSYHGMCISLVYEKQFSIFINSKRGAARFNDYGELLGISNHLFNNFSEFEKSYDYLEDINYTIVSRIIEQNKNNSIEWLESSFALQKKEVMSDFDASLIKLDEYMDSNINVRKSILKNSNFWTFMKYLKHFGIKVSMLKLKRHFNK